MYMMSTWGIILKCYKYSKRNFTGPYKGYARDSPTI